MQIAQNRGNSLRMKSAFGSLVVWTAIMILEGIPAWAETFTTNDQIVSDPAADIPDPEFDSVGHRMVWQDEEGNLWVANLDPDTGTIIPTDGKGILVDTGLYPVDQLLNGPEWAYGSDTIYIAYTKDVNGVSRLASARLDDNGDWVPEILQMGRYRLRPYGTPSSNSHQPRIVYLRQTGPGQQVMAWRNLGSPVSEITAEVSGGVGRWIEDEPAFVTVHAIDGVGQQVVKVDADTGAITQLTTDAGVKVQPYMWWAPEYNDYLLMTQIGTTQVGIYRKINRHWTCIYVIVLPSSKPYVNSPEPFVAGGRSYIFVVAAGKLGSFKLWSVGPTEIWVAGVDASAPFFCRVDDPTTKANRTEPEVYYTTSGPVIFYTQLDETSGRRILRRAATGLAP